MTKTLNNPAETFYQEYYKGKNFLIQTTREALPEINTPANIQKIQDLISQNIGITISTEPLDHNSKPADKIIIAESESKPGFIQDSQGKKVAAIAFEDFPLIYENRHTKIPSIPDNISKLHQAEQIMQQTDKRSEVVFTSIDQIHQEITTLLGAGTLIYSQEKSDIEPISKKEKDIFDLAYKQYTDLGLWKKRSPKGKKELLKNHYVFNSQQSTLGGFSISEKELPHQHNQSGLCFECWWSQIPQNGIGYQLIKKGIEIAKAQNKLFFTFTKKNLHKSPELNLIKHNQITSESGAVLWTS